MNVSRSSHGPYTEPWSSSRSRSINQLVPGDRQILEQSTDAPAPANDQKLAIGDRKSKDTADDDINAFLHRRKTTDIVTGSSAVSSKNAGDDETAVTASITSDHDSNSTAQNTVRSERGRQARSARTRDRSRSRARLRSRSRTRLGSPSSPPREITERPMDRREGLVRSGSNRSVKSLNLLSTPKKTKVEVITKCSSAMEKRLAARGMPIPFEVKETTTARPSIKLTPFRSDSKKNLYDNGDDDRSQMTGMSTRIARPRRSSSKRNLYDDANDQDDDRSHMTGMSTRSARSTKNSFSSNHGETVTHKEPMRRSSSSRQLAVEDGSATEAEVISARSSSTRPAAKSILKNATPQMPLHRSGSRQHLLRGRDDNITQTGSNHCSECRRKLLCKDDESTRTSSMHHSGSRRNVLQTDDDQSTRAESMHPSGSRRNMLRQNRSGSSRSLASTNTDNQDSSRQQSHRGRDRDDDDRSRGNHSIEHVHPRSCSRGRRMSLGTGESTRNGILRRRSRSSSRRSLPFRNDATTTGNDSFGSIVILQEHPTDNGGEEERIVPVRKIEKNDSTNSIIIPERRRDPDGILASSIRIIATNNNDSMKSIIIPDEGNTTEPHTKGRNDPPDSLEESNNNGDSKNSIIVPDESISADVPENPVSNHPPANPSEVQFFD